MIDWTPLDTTIAWTAALASAACAIPGCFLFLRKQSMVADALTHAALPGVVVAFIVAGLVESGDAASAGGSDGWALRQSLALAGASIAGVMTIFLTGWVARTGWIRNDAAIGAVYTTLFAVGLILLRQFADRTDMDLDCVIYGQLELIGLGGGIPPEALTCGVMLCVNAVMVVVLHKELMVSSFDPEFTGAIGFRPGLLHYGLMTVITMTLVSAFEVVGSILVIGMLVIPPATAFFIARRLWPMIGISVAVAVSASVLGHLVAITAPAPITAWLGVATIQSVKTSGMIVLVAAAHLAVAIFAGPERGLMVRWRATRHGRSRVVSA